MFLLLILVHLQFPLGVLRLAALLGFPCWLLLSEWQTVREALLFLLCLHGCRRFIGVRGWAPSSGPSGFRKWVPSPSGPFPAVLCPSIGRPGGTGVRRLGCRVAAAGLLSALPRHSSCSIIPIPMPSSSPISIPGAALGNILGLGCQGCSGACSTPFSRLLQPSVRSVVDLEVMTFGRHPLPYPSLCGRVTLSVGSPFSLCSCQ